MTRPFLAQTHNYPHKQTHTMSDIDDEWSQFLLMQTQGATSIPRIAGPASITEEEKRVRRGSWPGEATEEISPPLTDPTAIRALIQPLTISTRTKIFYLNTTGIDIDAVFWRLRVVPYSSPVEGVIKVQRQFKFGSDAEIDAYVLRRNQMVGEWPTTVEQGSSSTTPSFTTQSPLDDPPFRPYVTEKVLARVANDNVNARKNRFQDKRVLTIGISRKDILKSASPVKKAFINCFAMTYRIWNRRKGQFCEFHVKVFNTAKFTVPGIVDLDDEILVDLQEQLLALFRDVPGLLPPNATDPTRTPGKGHPRAPLISTQPGWRLAFLSDDQLPLKKCIISIKRGNKLPTVTVVSGGSTSDAAVEQRIQDGRGCEKRVEYMPTRPNILVNSNFNCGFYLRQAVFRDILVRKYGIDAEYNRSNYPGIQCRIYIDTMKPLTMEDQTGRFDPVDRATLSPVQFATRYMIVSFIPFRTGRSLILGAFPLSVLHFVYAFVTRIMVEEYVHICDVQVDPSMDQVDGDVEGIAEGEGDVEGPCGIDPDLVDDGPDRTGHIDVPGPENDALRKKATNITAKRHIFVQAVDRP